MGRIQNTLNPAGFQRSGQAARSRCLVEVKMYKRSCLFLFLLLTAAFSLSASPATEAATELKGFFGESLARDIYQGAGRTIVPFKLNPNINGPDMICRLPNGMIEIHEVKAYSSWAGQSAMRTTAGNVPTYELSKRWCEKWIQC